MMNSLKLELKGKIGGAGLMSSKLILEVLFMSSYSWRSGKYKKIK